MPTYPFPREVGVSTALGSETFHTPMETVCAYARSWTRFLQSPLALGEVYGIAER